LAELLFYIVLWLRWKGWSRPLNYWRGEFPKSRLTPTDIIKMVEHHMSRSLKDAEDFLSDWHFGASIKTMCRLDAEEFLAWSAFSRRRHELTDDELLQITSCLDRVEAKVGLSWGNNGPMAGHHASDQKFAAHTWESNCSYHHLPLVFYVGFWIVKRIIGTPCLMVMGFRYKRRGAVGYWIRERDWSCGRRARKVSGPDEVLVFFHGICPGLVTYMQFLVRFRHQTVVLFEMPWVTFNPFCTEVPPADDFCRGVADVLDANGIERVCSSGHSYGSFMVAWLLHFPRVACKVTRVVLVSAPALNLFIVKTCKVVCYDKPFWFDYCLAHVFFRQFYWHQFVLTPADLPKGSTVVLCEEDELIPVAEVVRSCAEEGVRCYVVPRKKHAWEIVSPYDCAKVVQFIRESTGDPLENDKGIMLLFHTIRSSKLYNHLCDGSLQLWDLFMSLFITRGHSPFNLRVLTYLDEFWPGGRKSLSSTDLDGLSSNDSVHCSEDEDKVQ